MRRLQLVTDDTGSEQSGDMDTCHGCLTHSQTFKDRATQLLRKYKRALVTQLLCLMIHVSIGNWLILAVKVWVSVGGNIRSSVLPVSKLAQLPLNCE